MLIGQFDRREVSYDGSSAFDWLPGESVGREPARPTERLLASRERDSAVARLGSVPVGSVLPGPTDGAAPLGHPGAVLTFALKADLIKKLPMCSFKHGSGNTTPAWEVWAVSASSRGVVRSPAAKGHKDFLPTDTNHLQAANTG